MDDLIKRYDMRYIQWDECADEICGEEDDNGDWVRYADHAAALSEAQAEIARLRGALGSIAANTCCDGCQEAARVAQAALSPKTPKTP